MAWSWNLDGSLSKIQTENQHMRSGIIDCSVVICTRNRAEALEQTLRSFRNLEVPSGLQVELILVDNGSSDRTGEVIRTVEVPGMVIRHLHEVRPGKSRALNLAVGNAQGDVLLFTDDDVEPAHDWIEKMTTPLLDGRADAVAGRIVLGDELYRPWLMPFHGVFLACTEPTGESPDLIGASMGIRRSVFDTIGPFDANLGPGASGFGEEALLCRQMREMGMRILAVRDCQVVHHPDASRLLRRSWLSTAECIGRSDAYRKHHWEHAHITFPMVRKAWLLMKLKLRRLVRGHINPDAEGCPIWEISYLIRIAELRHFSSESRKPRNYPYRGLSGRI